MFVGTYLISFDGLQMYVIKLLAEDHEKLFKKYSKAGC